MKYVRKAIIIILAAIFFAAALIGVSVMFAVRNINVAVVSYSSAAGDDTCFENSVSEIKNNLASLSGKNLISVSEDDVASLVSDDGYARFVSAQKHYPCTIDVTLEERLETFAVLSGESYLIYDELGEYITTKGSNVNNLDGCPNILVGDDCDIKEIATIADGFKEVFSSLRSLVESITVSSFADNSDVLAFKLYSGLTLRLVDYEEFTSEKIVALYKEYLSLDDYSKTCGTISCYSDSLGQLYVYKV